jgi:hypothetical protein
MMKDNNKQQIMNRMRMVLFLLLAMMVLVVIVPSSAFQIPTRPKATTTKTTKTTTFQSERGYNVKTQCNGDESTICPTLSSSTRRRWLRRLVASGTTTMVAIASGGSTGFISSPMIAYAEEASSATTTVPSIEMKQFDDPQGLFSLRVPKDFFTLRRTQKGDLPDAKTGKGRRGSSIFTAGNMAKAEVVAVERFPTRVLLEENGIEATGDLSSFPGIGDPKAVANLIILRREKDTQKQGIKVLDSVQVTPDGKELTFRLKTEIEVQKPELLMEEFGISQLFRITIAKATLNSNDGNIMAVFASALEQDFNNGVDGPALEETVRSFQATDQAMASS